MRFLDRIDNDIKTKDWKAFYLSNKGRVCRYEYNIYLIFPMIIINQILMLMEQVFVNSIQGLVIHGIIALVVTLLTLWPMIVVTNKRLHDRGASGWRQVAYFAVIMVGAVMVGLSMQVNPQTLSKTIAEPVMYYMGLALAIMPICIFIIDIMALPGSEKPNQWGESPLKDHIEAQKNQIKENLRQAKENE